MLKNKLSVLILIICLFSALSIVLSGCGPKNTGKAEKKEMIAVINVTALSVSDKISLRYTVTSYKENTACEMTVSAKAEDGSLKEGKFDLSGEAEIESPAAGGMIRISLSLTDKEGKVLDTAELAVKDGLVQLTEDAVTLVVAEMTDDEKAHLVAGTGNPKKYGASGGTYEIERLGVPSITVNDGPAGVRYSTSVWYPSVMNITSSWDGDLISRVGGAIGRDSLALGIDIVLAPGMNIQKNVLGGRNFEYCSEDPLLTAFSASAYVNGMQDEGAGACLKHFAGNEQETNRGSVSSSVTERALREIYLKPFMIAVKESSPVSIMSSYNQLNGCYSSINKDLLTGILRDEWNYKGMVMSDWGAAGSIADKVNAQNDIKMPGDADDARNVLEGIRSGKIDKDALDKCCEHILYAVTQSPTFKKLEMNTDVDFDNNEKISEQAGADTIVLLKNSGGALPYVKGTSIALFGNGAYKTVFGGSGSGGVSPRKTVSIAKGISDCSALSVFDEENNIFLWSEAHSKTDPSKDAAVSEKYAEECAAGADTAVIVISRDSTEGADNSLAKGDYLLNDTEYEMIKRVADAFHAKGKKVTVLINAGSAIEVASWRDLADAILFIGYPGQNAGNSVAEILCGNVNPNAKTTMTWPLAYENTPARAYFPGNPGKAVYYEDIYVGYRYYGTFGVDVAYPFGYGLSYTQFGYSGFSVRDNADGSFTALLTVTNNGSVSGREIAQIYVSKPETMREQPKYELCGFKKTKLLKPGESETLEITISADSVSSYDTFNSRYQIDRGTYTFCAAASATDLRAETKAEVKEHRVLYDVENRCVPVSEPAHIIKSKYSIEAEKSEEDAIASMADTTLSKKIYTVDLKKEQEIGEIYLYWDNLETPFAVSFASEDEKYTRYDVFMADGLGFMKVNLCGTAARYLKIEPFVFGKLSDVKVFPATEEDKKGKTEIYRNLAYNKRVKAASVEGSLVPSNAVDGDFTTRWGSLQNGESWLLIDLRTVSHIKGMMLYLEAAWVPYRIEYSNDKENFTTLASFGSGELFVKLKDLDVDARYVRIIREGENWFSIYEVAIYG